MLIPSVLQTAITGLPSLSRRVNANSQQLLLSMFTLNKLIKKGEC